MKKILSIHSWWISCNGFFLLTGVLLLAYINQGEEIIYLNKYRSNLFDIIFKNWTLLAEGLTYLLVFGWLLYHRRDSAFLVPMLGLLVIISMPSLKYLFQHERPWNFF